jgi:hypothetical protein
MKLSEAIRDCAIFTDLETDFAIRAHNEDYHHVPFPTRDKDREDIDKLRIMLATEVIK